MEFIYTCTLATATCTKVTFAVAILQDYFFKPLDKNILIELNYLIYKMLSQVKYLITRDKLFLVGKDFNYALWSKFSKFKDDGVDHL